MATFRQQLKLLLKRAICAWMQHSIRCDTILNKFYRLQVGWRHQATVAELEGKRKEVAAGYYAQKKKLAALRSKAVQQVANA